MKRTYIVFLAVCALLCLGAGFAWKLRRGGSDKGIFIEPEGEYPPGQAAVFCQRDSRWAEDRMGDSFYTMGSSGCLTCCIASALSSGREDGTMEPPVTPGEMNRLFGETGVYNESGDIVWGRLEKALPKVKVLVASSVDAGEIEELLARGRYPIVKVKVGGTGAGHWVLLVGTQNGEYLCMDPLNESGELISLSRHGSVVYRMRCVYFGE